MSMPAFLKVSVLGKRYLGLVLESIALSGEKLKTALRDICNLHELFSIELITKVIIIYWPLATNSQRLAWVCGSCRRWLHWCFNCSISNNKNVKEFKQAVHWASNGNACLLRKAPWVIEHKIVFWDIGWKTLQWGQRPAWDFSPAAFHGPCQSPNLWRVKSCLFLRPEVSCTWRRLRFSIKSLLWFLFLSQCWINHWINPQGCICLF